MRRYKKIITTLVKDIRNYGLLIPFANRMWHFRKYIPISIFNAITEKKHNEVKKQILKIIGNIDTYNLSLTFDKDYSDNPPIWFCWWQGEGNMPDTVLLCLNSIKKHAGNHVVNIINFSNYDQYIQLPDNIKNLQKENKIGLAHFADVVRTALLYQYGGCWIDSTVYLTDKLDDKIFEPCFFSVKIKEDPFFISKCRWCNFFLVAQKGNKMMEVTLKMFYLYLERTETFLDYFLMDYFIDIASEKYPEIKAMIDNVPHNNENVHLLLKHLETPYSPQLLKEICTGTYIHKLSWKQAFKLNDGDKPTMYGHIAQLQ